MEVAPFLSIFTIFCRFSPFFIDFHDLRTFVAIYILSRFTHFFCKFFLAKIAFSATSHVFCMYDSLLWVANSFERPLLLNDQLSWALSWETNSYGHFFECFSLLGNFLSPLWSKAKIEGTLLSTQKSALTLKSLFLSGSTLASALLGAFWRALGPPEP